MKSEYGKDVGCVEMGMIGALGELKSGRAGHTSLEAWKEAHAVSLGVLKLARTGWRPHASALFSQLQRASLSVELNIAEGYTFGRSPSFTRHLGIAFGSAVETSELLRLGLEAGVLDAGTASPLLDRSDRTRRLLLGLLKQRRKFKL